jgi:hypothetical protein
MVDRGDPPDGNSADRRLAVWCSTLCRTSGGAFISTYAVAAVMFLVPALIVVANQEWKLGLVNEYAENLVGTHLPPAVWFFTKAPSIARPKPLLGCLVIGVSALLFLLLATYHLPRRAFARGRR